MDDKEAFEAVQLLLQHKLDYFLLIKKITEGWSPTDRAEAADSYISMIDKREYVLKEIEEIDDMLKQPAYTQVMQNALFCGDVNKRKQEIKDVVKKIIALDNDNKEHVEHVKKDLLLKVGDLKKGKELSAAYNQGAAFAGSARFDSKN